MTAHDSGLCTEPGCTHCIEQVFTWKPGETRMIRYGDKLLVNIGPNRPAETAVRLQETLSARLPGVDVIVVGVEQLAVYIDPYANVGAAGGRSDGTTP